MQVKSLKEIQNLDEDLKLFDESAWDFLDVDQTQENYEYFNDIRDADFNVDSSDNILKNSAFTGVLSMVATSLVVILFFIVKMNVLDKAEYNEVRGISSVSDRVIAISHIEGSKVDAGDMAKMDEVLNTYFQTLNDGEGYRHLYGCCAVTSTFADTYTDYTSAMRNNFDENDCYARALRAFGKTYKYQGISEAVYKNGIYYCYVVVASPTDINSEEYVYSWQYDLNKYFQSHEISTSEMLRFLTDQMEIQPMTVDVSEVCIRFVEDDNGLVILDDSNITNQCISAYTSATMQMTYLVSGIHR